MGDWKSDQQYYYAKRLFGELLKKHPNILPSTEEIMKWHATYGDEFWNIMSQEFFHAFELGVRCHRKALEKE